MSNKIYSFGEYKKPYAVKSFNVDEFMGEGDSSGIWEEEHKAFIDGTNLKSLFFSEDWVFILLDLVADHVAMSPMVVKKMVADPGGKAIEEIIDSHPALTLLDNPNPYQEYSTWIYNYTVELDLMGNAMVFYAKNKQNMIIIPAETVSLQFDRDQAFAGYSVFTIDQGVSSEAAAFMNKNSMFIKKELVWHQRRPNPQSLLWGLSPFVPNRKNILFNRYTQDWLNSFYLKGATPTMALSIDRATNDDAAQRLLRTFELAYTGRRNMRRPLLLPKGVTVDTLSPTVADQQLIELVRANREQIINILRVPKHALSLAETGSLGSEEHKEALKFLYTGAIIPTQKKIARHLTRKFQEVGLLEEDERLEFDNSEVEVLREDMIKKAELSEKMKSTHTVNEIRSRIWDDEPIEGGDILESEKDRENPFPGFVGLPMAQAPSSAKPKPTDDAAPSEDGVPADAEVATTQAISLNGAQIASLLDVINQVSQGLLPREAAVNIIRVAFSLPSAQAEEMLAGVTFGSNKLPPEEAAGVKVAEKDITAEIVTPVETKVIDDDLMPQEQDKRDRTLKAITAKYSDHLKERSKQSLEIIESKTEESTKFWIDMSAKFAREAGDIVKRELAKANPVQKAVDDGDAPDRIPSKKRLEKMLERKWSDAEAEWLDKYTQSFASVVDDAYDIQVKPVVNADNKEAIEALKTDQETKRRRSLEARSLDSFTNIGATKTEQIMSIIEREVTKKTPLREIGDIVAEEAKINPKKAAMIARHEALTAVSIGKVAALDDAVKIIPDMVKVWINLGDLRVRGRPDGLYPDTKADHWTLQGETVEVDEPFSNGLMYPRDVKSSELSEVIGCRCDFLMVPREDIEALQP